MKQHAFAHDRIIEASRREPENQCLFLVADTSNTTPDAYAVMLHDGTRKLGSVAWSECAAIRKFIDSQSYLQGHDIVLVAYVSKFELDDFHWSTSFNVRVVGMVYERVARKFAQSITGEK